MSRRRTGNNEAANLFDPGGAGRFGRHCVGRHALRQGCRRFNHRRTALHASQAGRVILTVDARGELQGGNSEMLTAPMTGGGDVAITFLRAPGELVNSGDTVVTFDTTEQEFKLKEAEADLAEAEQQVIKAEAESQATEEESRWTAISTDSDVKLAELEIRRNPLLPAINARQNDLSLEAAHNRLRQAQQDFENKKTTSSAGIAIQVAAQNKAKVPP